ncbi:heat shock protein transcriptional repressor HspR [Thermocrinis minervae]|uniref:MerR family transcriptional regulator, heat shock protein HspR n=1 Tax=Thermocrinis minervae TaxID=381751 RepID=A0A1M6R8J6_9AQUI|nr:helix-turn-helix transcriptional regulator [Thermocrinis minervae]SHK28760.1 MerR family transcriptional regulator, heat shock protein HspR [Thermocrinis minervae]
MKKKKVYFTIGSVAEMFNIHPQTLRLYEREGLIKPQRTAGGTRRYTEEDIKRIEIIVTLTREFGVNLAGVDIILRMKEQIEELESQIEKLLTFIKEELKKGKEDEKSLAVLEVKKVAKLWDIIKEYEDKRNRSTWSR